MVLSSKKILLTGATGGIGGAIAKALSDEGATLILTARDEEKLTALKENIGNVRHQILALDLNNNNDREKLYGVVEKENIDVLINNAGINQLSLLEDTSDADISQIVSTNLVVPMMLCREIHKTLKQRPESVIVNIGSILGSIGYAGSTSYCASKFGLRGFTEAFRREVADSTVNVIYFAPRATDTALNTDKMNTLNEALGNAVDSPEHVAQRLIDALKDKHPHSYFLGWPESLFVRLNSLLPNVVDKALLKQLPVIRRFSQ
ncbi:short chain dehydrogenase [marine gamma proteobacterium HTCC2143]|uniref:Short chain dehydrogenase n=1 Tax=marine gamma proteobacterium HTCC2143 TaxID=247633 RepID=A0YB51_9GAMM|nr:short chain dehydrogenase [marine gamma proteobacterium HTCC2143]